MKKPRRKQVRDETFRLLIDNGLTGWKVRFNPRLTRALGRCIPSQYTIEYQTRYIEQNDWEQVLTTIKHEVAHAIAVYKYGHRGHGATWARIARQLGLEKPSAINLTATITKKFTGTCPNTECGRTIQKDRRTDSSCGKCSNGGLYDPKYAFVWTRN